MTTKEQRQLRKLKRFFSGVRYLVAKNKKSVRKANLNGRLNDPTWAK